MKIGVLGSGGVGQQLSKRFAELGHEVQLGTRTPSKPELSGLGVPVATFAEVAAAAEVVVLAVHGEAAPELLGSLSAEVEGKVVIDTTNPFAQDEGGHHFWTSNLGQLVQNAAPGARVVKAFNTVGNSLMLDPPAVTPPMTMPICGDDAAAKETVTGLLSSAGWAVTDVGGIRQAEAVEGLGLIWVRHGVVTGTWDHIVTVRPF